MTACFKADLTFNERALLQMIETAADAGLPCPSNTKIADSIQTYCGSTLLCSLKRKGLVRIESAGARRIVTILASGKRTAAEMPNQQLRPSEKRKNRRTQSHLHRPDPETLPRVDRDACFYCGSRGDVCQCRKGRS